MVSFEMPARQTVGTGKWQTGKGVQGKRLRLEINLTFIHTSNSNTIIAFSDYKGKAQLSCFCPGSPVGSCWCFI